MKSHIITLVMAACIMTVMTARWRRADNDDDDNLNLTPSNETARACKTKDMRDGICVDEGQCTEEHDIIAGGVIDDSDLRAGTCAGKYEWCCVLQGFIPTSKPNRVNIPDGPGCKVAQRTDCPSCVGVYRDGGNPRTKSPTGLFCGGTVLGSRIILTAASCVLSAQNQKVWVQKPGSTRQYAVENSVKHSQFNSGTRELDTALLLLSEDIKSEGDTDGACLGLRTPLAGECVSAGFDAQDKLILTPLSVTNGGCTERGSVFDAACGRNSGSCSVSPGSPVLCPADDSGYLVAGIARQSCAGGSVLLGSLTQSADWLRGELTKNGLEAQNYTRVV